IINEKKIVFDERQIQKHEIENEKDRYNLAIEILSRDIEEYIEKYAFSKEDKEILDTHKLILTDPDIKKGIFDLVSEDLHNLEQATTLYFNKTINFFKNMDNEFYAERAIDYKDTYERLMNYLLKKDDTLSDQLEENCIVVMEDIPPSMISEIVKRKAQGLILQRGSKTSHSVILARAMNLPVITGIHFYHKIHDNDMIILDAEQGQVIVNPDQETIERFEELKLKEDIEFDYLKNIISLPTETADGEKIHLMANIELPTEIDTVSNIHADGVGLFRTEFFYINRALMPSETEQFNIYKNIAIQSKGKPVIIRTIDIGGDKLANWYPHFKEDNPYLGCRGIRFSLKYPNVFKTQIKAILKASVFGNIHIMFPLISSIEEFRIAKKYVIECMKELDEYSIEYNQDIKIGTMIEIPSAALISDILAKESDFFSIGTNDLLQYTVAVDRNNENVANYYNLYNHAFLHLIKITAESAIKHKKPVAVCGEIASDEQFIALLLKFGIKELSVNLHNLLRVKQYIRSISYQKLIEYPDKLNTLMESSEIKYYLDNLKQSILIKQEGK
ncbi:MAG TPA: phosphoenolpyruvate--protein phosphotransferase, partial [Candidatus Cloacimonadota bacterium]|nr:phosphoenolpyruvate--protein phosphotransferase [Candidatus Cloacimonadota bacterium]